MQLSPLMVELRQSDLFVVYLHAKRVTWVTLSFYHFNTLFQNHNQVNQPINVQ